MAARCCYLPTARKGVMSVSQAIGWERDSAVWSRTILCSIVALLLAMPALRTYWADGHVSLEDDAYYYIVIARSIAQGGTKQIFRSRLHPMIVESCIL